MPDQPVKIFRKKPRQARAAATIETILDAAAHVLHGEGEAALTTNRIAERAGLSIGSLYQYFPNKIAVLHAYAQRERERTLQQLRDAITAPDVDDIEIAMKKLIAIVTGVFGGRSRLHAIFILRLRGDETFRRVQLTMEHVAELLETEINRGRFAGVGPVSPLRMFVLTRALLNTVRAAALDHKPGRFKSAELQAELLRLALAYMKSDDAPRPSLAATIDPR